MRSRSLITAALFAATLFAMAAIAAPEPPSPTDPKQQEAPEDDPILGAPADIRPPDDAGGERLWIDPGTPLRSQPDVRSPAVAIVDVAVELVVLEHREHWVLVRYGSWKGWISTHEDTTVPSTSDPLSPELAAWKLALAREMLALPARAAKRQPNATLGPFDLVTDVSNRRLLRFLARIALSLRAAFRDRFGVDPGPGTDEAVILFSREKDYRAYEAEVRPETDRGTLGHADQGLAILYVGRQGPDDVAAVLVHELVHVLNRRWLATVPPPWLEEGLANDLAFSRIDGAGRLDLGSLGGRNVLIEEHFYQPGGWIDFEQAVHLSGPAATFSLLAKRWREGGAVSLELLCDLLASEFFETEDRQVRYDASTFFVRYLLDGEDGELAPRFRAFLASLATGGSADPDTLASSLGRSWAQLEAGFKMWLEGFSSGGPGNSAPGEDSRGS